MALVVVAEPLRETPEDVVDEILLRLPCPSSLVRAAAACSSFRLLVSSPSFLRRHRALHPGEPGPFLGVFSSVPAYGNTGGTFHPAGPHHPAAAAACAVAGAADFSFDFLPGLHDAESKSGGWLVRDYRDGRFLLDRATSDNDIVTDLAVCDPVSRRYVLLPPIPEDLAAAADNPLGVLGGRRWCEPFLAPAPAPADSDSDDSAPAFAVIWTARCPRRVVALAFSSRDGAWRALPSPDCFVWRSRGRSIFSCPAHAVWNRRHYAHGRFYWVDCLTNRWLVLDTRGAMELAVEEVRSPARFWEENVAVVEGPDGAVGVFAHDFYHADGNPCLNYYTISRDNADADSSSSNTSSSSWQLEKTIPLPWSTKHGRPYCLRGAGNGCLVIEVSQDSPRPLMSSHYRRDVELFAIDTTRFQLERVCQTRCSGGVSDGWWPYFGFPPLLSLPTV